MQFCNFPEISYVLKIYALRRLETRKATHINHFYY